MTNQRHSPLPGERKAQAQTMQELVRDAFAAPPAAPTPDFRTAVWARINAHQSPATWAQWLHSHKASVATATAACALLAAMGGGWLAYQQNHNQRSEQILFYLSSIDAHQRLTTQAESLPPALRQ